MGVIRRIAATLAMVLAPLVVFYAILVGDICVNDFLDHE